jgi:hypothetical protein
MRRKRFLPGALVLALALGACDDSATSGPGRGQLTIQLTDAPGDLTKAFIKVDHFVLIRSEDDTSSIGRIELEPDEAGFIELIALAGGKLLNVVDEADVPEGNFVELRVVIDEAFVELKDGRVFATPGADLPAGVESDGELKCPSCSTSGFKVKFTNEGGLFVSDNTIVVLDFDVNSSFVHEAGRSGKLIMHPVLHATSRTIALGRITGNVALATNITIPACGGQTNKLSAFRPTATTGTDTFTGATDTLGVYNIGALVPATYTLGHVLDITFANGDSLTFAATPSVASVVVPPGDSAKANFTITAATCH